MDNMDFISLLKNLAVSIIPLLFAITIHEAAHAWVAHKRGDKTAFMMGRVSLNPSKHIDLFGTLLMPIMLYFATMGKFWFGYAKPVPIDSRYFKNYKLDMFLSIAAGPISNLIMAFIWAFIMLAMLKFNAQEQFFMLMTFMGIKINLSLFALNLLPILPLDGGRIAILFMPTKMAQSFSTLEPYGFMLVMLLSIVGVLYTFWMQPIMYVGEALIMNLIKFMS
jgi:Zn-dependent protease